VERDAVLISPGIPFLVPTFLGLVVAFTYGDLLFGLLSAAGAL
jgi:preflagellin peptidase FlaK